MTNTRKKRIARLVELSVRSNNTRRSDQAFDLVENEYAKAFREMPAEKQRPIIANIKKAFEKAGRSPASINYEKAYGQSMASTLEKYTRQKGKKLTLDKIGKLERFAGYNMSDSQRGIYAKLSEMKESDKDLFKDFLRVSGLRVERDAKGRVIGSRSLESIAKLRGSRYVSATEGKPVMITFIGKGKQQYQVRVPQVVYKYKKNGSPERQIIGKFAYRRADEYERDKFGKLILDKDGNPIEIWHETPSLPEFVGHYKKKP